MCGVETFDYEELSTDYLETIRPYSARHYTKICHISENSIFFYTESKRPIKGNFKLQR